MLSFSISTITTHLWESNYTDYQQYLFTRICVYKEGFLTPIGYRKISKIFNEEGLKTPRNGQYLLSSITFILCTRKVTLERNESIEKILLEVSQPYN